MDEFPFGTGLIESPIDERDWILQLAAPTEPLPLIYNAYNLSGSVPVLNQGKSSRCVAYASAAMKMWQEKIDEKRWLIFDVNWFYRACKVVDGYPFEEGTTIRAAMKVLKNRGIPLQNRAGIGASRHKIAAYYTVPKDIHSIKLAIMQYGPVVTGARWANSWFKPINGVLPPPDKIEGGHATEYYGWNDTIVTPAGVGGILAQNSWGNDWGIGGSYIIPYAYLKYITEIFKAVDVIDGEKTTTPKVAINPVAS